MHMIMTRLVLVSVNLLFLKNRMTFLETLRKKIFSTGFTLLLFLWLLLP